MTAKYWTTNGEDIWMMTERRVFDFKNLETGDVVTCGNSREVMDANLVPVAMPDIKTKKVSTETPAEISTVSESPSRRGQRSKTRHKGVSPAVTQGKFRAQFWDKKKNKNIYLGTFDSELLAAAAVEEHKGNKKEAIRLLNEHQEGDPAPVDKGKFPSEE